MTSVWALYRDEYEYRDLVAVFSTKEKAEDYQKEVVKSYKGYWAPAPYLIEELIIL